jgi:quercetin dioxygenase-like cupin family protein
MSDPIIAMGVCANIFARQIHFQNAGDTELGHKHEFDHLTLLAKGKVKVTVNGQESEFTAPTMIYIRAELIHEITALTDNSVMYCIHGLRDAQKSGDIIAPEMVPTGSELRALLSTIAIKDAVQG